MSDADKSTADAVAAGGSFAIVTDSACDMGHAWLEGHGVGVVPFHVSIDGMDRLDLIELDPVDLYVALARSRANGSVSSPSPGEWGRAYEAAAEAGFDRIVSVHISSRLSGSIEQARAASATLAERLGREIRVEHLDTHSVSAAEGLVVEDLVRSREAGVGFDEALEHALALRDSVSMYLIPAEGVALGTDGRAPRGIAGLIDRVSARFSGTRDLLRLDPDGIVAGVESSSDFARLCATLAREMSMAAHRHHVSIAYVEVGAGMPRTLTALEKPLNTNEFRSRRLGIANAGGATVCRVGLGAVGVAFVPSSLLRDETLAAVDAARREAGIQQQSL